MLKGVITGDLINSTNIAVQWTQKVIDEMNGCVLAFHAVMEMYRGDSFQVVVDKPETALALAVALRAKLRALTPDNERIWDARVSVGVGDVSFEWESIAISDGEAFRLSGRSFDSMGKKRLAVSTPHDTMDRF